VQGGISGRRFGIAVGVLVALLVGGTVAFRLILHESWLRSFYRAVVSTSLTGLDSNPKGPGAIWVTMVLVLGGVALFAFVAGVVAEALLGGLVTGAWGEKRKKRAIGRMRDHYIICGYGRVGKRVAAEFREAGAPFVVLDYSELAAVEAKEQGDVFVGGNGTDDHSLREAGLETARGLVASSDSDVDNLYIVLSARTARPELMIVARASTEDAAQKLRLAGADRIVQPYLAAGRQMANLMLKPQVSAFLDAVTSAAGPDLHFEEIEVTSSSGRAGKTLRELQIRQATGALVVAIRQRDGDVVIAAGTLEELRALEDLFAARGAVAR
jgi:voltage-gated potassium channel